MVVWGRCGRLAYDFFDFLEEVIPAILAEFLGVFFSFLDIGVFEHGYTFEVLVEDPPVELDSWFGGRLSSPFWFDNCWCFGGFGCFCGRVGGGCGCGLLRLLCVTSTWHGRLPENKEESKRKAAVSEEFHEKIQSQIGLECIIVRPL